MIDNTPYLKVTSSDDRSGFRRFWWPSEFYNDIFQIEYSDDPDVVFVSAAGSAAIGKIDCRTGAAIWNHLLVECNTPMDYTTVLGISYNPHVRRLVAAVHYYVRDPSRRRVGLIELDGDTGKQIRSLFDTHMGPLGQVWGVHYRDNSAATAPRRCQNITWSGADHDLVAVAACDSHVAGLLNLSTGKWEKVFGRYGRPGDNLTSLNSPRDITFIGDGAWITDQLNHRVLFVEFSGAEPRVTALMPFPNPSSVRYTMDAPGSKVISANAAVSTESRYQPFTGIFSDFDVVGSDSYTSLLAHIPVATNIVAFNPFDPFVLMVNQWNSVFEVDWRNGGRELAHLKEFHKPLTQDNGHGYVDVGPEECWISEPIIGMGYELMQIRAYSSRDAVMLIEAPTLEAARVNIVKPGFEWAVVDSFDLQAGRISPCGVEFPPPVYRIRVPAGSEASRISMQITGR